MDVKDLPEWPCAGDLLYDVDALIAGAEEDAANCRRLGYFEQAGRCERTAAALLALRDELAQFHNVVIPSWKREEEAWERERDALRAERDALDADYQALNADRTEVLKRAVAAEAERDALRSKLQEWADECRECHGAGTVPHLFHDGDEDCLACSHIRALLPALAPAEHPAGKEE